MRLVQSTEQCPIDIADFDPALLRRQPLTATIRSEAMVVALTTGRSGPLADILVIAVEQAVAAPLCTLRLAEAGARVIKIERAQGDTARQYDQTVCGMSAYFVWLNHGKESVVLDLKSADDRDLLDRMISKADVFVQNLAPGAIDRLGFSGRELVSKYPRLIAASIVGYGAGTSYESKRAYDMIVQAESGLCAVTGTPDEPSRVGVSVADIATGMNAYQAILEALLERVSSGAGAVLETAMFDGIADWMAVPLLHYEAGQQTARYGLAHASIYPYRSYVCKSGESVIIAVQNQDEWNRFCQRVLRNPAVATDARFATNAGRVANRVSLDAEIEANFANMAYNEAVRRLDEAQMAWGRLTELADLPVHPALRRLEVVLPNEQRVLLPRPTGQYAARSSNRVPALGAHTECIRTEFEIKA